MLECLKCVKDVVDKKNTGIFAAGLLVGTAGLKLLKSQDAKNVYTNCTAAVLRVKDCVMNVVTNVQAEAEDIYAAAQEINEERAAKAAEKEAAEIIDEIIEEVEEAVEEADEVEEAVEE